MLARVTNSLLKYRKIKELQEKIALRHYKVHQPSRVLVDPDEVARRAVLIGDLGISERGSGTTPPHRRSTEQPGRKHPRLGRSMVATVSWA